MRSFIDFWARKVHHLAIEKGWWDKAKRADGTIDLDIVRSLIPEKLFMMVTEICEIGDAVRNRQPPIYWDLSLVLDPTYAKTTPEMLGQLNHRDTHTMLVALGVDANQEGVQIALGRAREVIREKISERYKPEGWAIELADTIIRCLDFGEVLGVNIELMMDEKHRYNQTRPYLHGGKPF